MLCTDAQNLICGYCYYLKDKINIYNLTSDNQKNIIIRNLFDVDIKKYFRKINQKIIEQSKFKYVEYLNLNYNYFVTNINHLNNLKHLDYCREDYYGCYEIAYDCYYNDKYIDRLYGNKFNFNYKCIAWKFASYLKRIYNIDSDANIDFFIVDTYNNYKYIYNCSFEKLQKQNFIIISGKLINHTYKTNLKLIKSFQIGLVTKVIKRI